MRLGLALNLALSLALAASAAADDLVTIASGVSGGTYRSVYAKDLEARLGPGRTVIHRLSSGSGENLQLLAAGRADFAFAQADVFAGLLRAEPERFGVLGVVGRLGRECVYLAVRRGGPVRTLEALGAPVGERPAEIAVGPAKGGPSGTWRHLVTLRPELKAAVAHPVGDRVALRYLERGTFDAVVWVTDPDNLEHRMLRAVRESAALELAALDAAALADELPDGSRVYEPGEVRLARGAPAVPTICTSAVLLARRETDPSLLRAAAGMPGLRRP